MVRSRQGADVLELGREILVTAVGGAPVPRTWGKVALDYARACGDGALTALSMTGVPTPHAAGIGCAAGIAGQGAANAIQWHLNRR